MKKLKLTLLVLLAAAALTFTACKPDAEEENNQNNNNTEQTEKEFEEKPDDSDKDKTEESEKDADKDKETEKEPEKVDDSATKLPGVWINSAENLKYLFTADGNFKCGSTESNSALYIKGTYTVADSKITFNATHISFDNTNWLTKADIESSGNPFFIMIAASIFTGYSELQLSFTVTDTSLTLTQDGETVTLAKSTDTDITFQLTVSLVGNWENDDGYLLYLGEDGVFVSKAPNTNITSYTLGTYSVNDSTITIINKQTADADFQTTNITPAQTTTASFVYTYGALVLTINNQTILLTLSDDQPEYLNGKYEYSYCNEGQIYVDYLTADKTTKKTIRKESLDGTVTTTQECFIMYNPVFKYLAAKSTKVTTGTTVLNSKAEAEAYDTTKGDTQYASNFDWSYVPAEIDEEYSILTLGGVMNYYPINENCSYPFARKIFRQEVIENGNHYYDFFVCTGDFVQFFYDGRTGAQAYSQDYKANFWNFDNTLGLSYINPTDDDPVRLEKLQNAVLYFDYIKDEENNTFKFNSKIEPNQNLYDVYVTNGIVSFFGLDQYNDNLNFLPMTSHVVFNGSTNLYYKMTEENILFYNNSSFTGDPETCPYTYSSATQKITLTKSTEYGNQQFTLEYKPLKLNFSELMSF